MESGSNFAELLGTEMVTLLVGKDRERFVVHKNLLVSRSHYFKGALTGSLYKEALEGVMALEEDDPDAVRLLISWLYQGRLPRVRPFTIKPDFSKYKQRKKSQVGAPVPLSTKNNPSPTTASPDPQEEGKEIMVLHLSGRDPFQRFSPEEVRLADYENAMDHFYDPLRRDAAVTSKPEKADDDKKKKKKKPVSHGRRNWLERKLPIGQSPHLQHPPQTVAVTGNQELAEPGQPTSPPANLSTDSVSPRTSEVPQPAPTSKPTPTAHPTGPASNGGQPPADLLLHSQPNFTFRVDKASGPETAKAANSVPTATHRPMRMSYAAVAAMGRHTIGGLSSPLTSTSASSAGGSSPSERDRKRTKSASERVEREPERPVAAATRTTAQDWAAEIANGPPTIQPPTESSEQSSDETEEDPAWPFKVSPEAAAMAAISWLDWKLDPKGSASHVGREEAFQENNRHQRALLRLAVMAERFCWDELFNVAMDAFLDGEVVMNRSLVPLDYIETVYSSCYPSSPLRRFLSDMVHFEVKTCLTYSRYLDLAQTYEDFLGDLFKRLDYQVWIPGKNPFTTLRNPLKVRRCHYHAHEDWKGCCSF